MSARTKGVVALIVLGSLGSCWYFDAYDRCFSSGGGWRTFSGCYGVEGAGDSPRSHPVSSPGEVNGSDLTGAGPLRELHRGQVVVRLVDSTHWSVEEGLDMEGDLWRIEIAYDGRLDTISSIRVNALPVFESDSVITGLGYVEGELQSGFRYSVAHGKVDTIPLVEEIRRRWIDPELSPDGRLIAYWALKGDGVGQIEVADWPTQRAIRAGPIQVVGGGDASPGFARWLAIDTLEYAIWGEEGRILRGRWTPSGFGPVDTTRETDPPAR